MSDFKPGDEVIALFCSLRMQNKNADERSRMVAKISCNSPDFILDGKETPGYV
jgi:hypothetical protein